MKEQKKMRKSLWMFLAASFVTALAFLTVANAQSVSGGPINVSASVPSGLALDLKIVDQVSAAQVPSMDFGELVRMNSEFRAGTFFKVYLTANAAGNSFVLTQTGTSLTRNGGPETIPNGAYIVKPEYVDSDNSGAAQPVSSTVGNRGSATGTRTLYTDPTGSSRIITLTYTLSGDPNTGATEIIPLSQKSGSYSGTVQFTLTTV